LVMTSSLAGCVLLLSVFWSSRPLLGEAAVRTVPPDPSDGVTREMLDQEEHNRKQGFAMGTTGEYFRYKHVFHKQPSESDREEAIGLATKIRCDACFHIVSSLLMKASSLDEDGLADQLEGNVDYEKTGDHVTDAMLSHKKGCNKHFKDELISRGWTLRTCKEVVPERNDTEPCLHQEANAPSQQAQDSYELWKEVLFYACEQTVGRFGDALAQHLAEALPGSSNRSSVVHDACRDVARCLPRSRQAATKKKDEVSKEGSKKGRRRRRRNSGSSSTAEL